MSELIDNHQRRKSILKHLMQQLHEGEAPQAVRTQLARLMGEVPYQTVVEVEQELLAEGLPARDILKFCDIHTEVLKGNIQAAAPREIPPGHPVHTFQQENRALQWELDALERLFGELDALPDSADASALLNQIRIHVHHLADADKHYSRKENLLFPYLERHGITGPSKVMWAKDDAARELVQGAIEALSQVEGADTSEAKALAELVLKPAHAALADMIYREEQILFPMSLDALSEDEWYAIWRQSPAIGFCLYDPKEDWRPAHLAAATDAETDEQRIQLPSGSLTPAELQAILNNIPFDLTFVDRDDRVRYFTQGRERIFVRTRAILGRKVQLCHPPDSVHVVQQILDDFKSGRQSRAPFWINLKGRFIHIEYFALRDPDGRYLGTLEVSQDLTEKRSLQGEQRLLQYAGEEKHVQ
ncbi:MAG: DUF438 domain-containing protein [Acidobacteriota bacterium]